MKFVYLDKRDRVRAWFRLGPRTWAFAAVGLFLLLPLWHESIEGRFILEAAERAAIRAEIPGVIAKMYADEGQTITQGSVLGQIRNLALVSEMARTESDYRKASAEFRAAESRHGDTGLALTRRDQLERQNYVLSAEAANLELTSPISGVVTTPRVGDEVGRFVTAGAEVVEVADLGTMRARMYVSEYDMHKYSQDASGRLAVDGMLRKWDVGHIQVSPASSEIAPGLIDLAKFNGMRAPTFYEMDLRVSNAGGMLKPGMVGTARVYGKRRSLAGLAYREIAEFFGRKVW